MNTDQMKFTPVLFDKPDFSDESPGQALIYREGDGVVALCYDLKEKGYNIFCTGSDGSAGGKYISIVMIDRGDDRELVTLSFPEYEGWDVWAVGIGRYTLSICLTKDYTDEPVSSI